MFSDATSDAVAKELGHRLKQARLNANITQEDLSEVIGLDRQTISRAERGKCQLTTFVAILAGLGLVDHLESFLPAQKPTPIQLRKLMGKQRQKASRSPKSETAKDDEGLEW